MNSEDKSSNEWKMVKKGKRSNKIQNKDDPMKAFFLKIKKELDEEFSYLRKNTNNKDISQKNIQNTTNIFSLLKEDLD
tara:strand:+ start:182 stop:415 length:234 start_codon:yes stop_codon:yes gene_type:complete